MRIIDSATILIRNYNGKKLLEQLLPSLRELVQKRNKNDEILVVDDGSADGSVRFLNEHFPDVRVERIIPNSGNSIVPVNVGVKAADHPVVICLDNDVLVDEDFITPVLDHFGREDVFAVCPKIINPNHENTIESLNYPFFRRGRLVGIVPGRLKGIQMPEESVFVWYAPGNGAAYDRSKFIDLGGLDDLYRPIYNEDVDICHRAWKRGWKTIFEPSVCTYHLKHITTKKHLKRKRNFDVYRNKNALLFTWKNLHEKSLFHQHLIWIFPHLLKSLITADMTYPRSLWWALKQSGEVFRKRREEKAAGHVSDKKIFELLYGLHHNSRCEALL